MANYYSEKPPSIPEIQYEFLDHTADVQIHAWGDSVIEAFEQTAMGMFNYMTTDFSTVELVISKEIEAKGDDMLSLLYHFLDEWLYLFSAEPYFFPRVIEILEFHGESFRIRAKGWGETFDPAKHPSGTEVKAITYSNMQIKEKDGRHEVFVIVDI